MKRRIFLKSALAVPLLGKPTWMEAVIGAREPQTIVCVNYPPGPGKTLALLEVALRICGRYPANVILSGADGSVVSVRQRLDWPAVPRRDRLEDSKPQHQVDDPRAMGAGVHGVDPGKWDQVAAYDLAVRLQRKALFGYSLIIRGEWSAFIDHARPFQIPSTRFIPQQVQSQLWAAGLRLAVAFDVAASTHRWKLSTVAARSCRNWKKTMNKSKSDEVLADFIAHGATEEEYRMFKAINEHHWPNLDDYEAETEFVEVA